MPDRRRTERLVFILTPDELTAVDEFRFRVRMPSRAAAIRELLKRGIEATDDEPREGKLTHSKRL